MRGTTVGANVHRTQEERSSATRAAILDATIDCLVEYGYVGTTGPRVAERAGVTRGAQVHHFGSKADLVVAAVKHLAARRAAAAVHDIAPILAAGDDAVERALDMLWEMHRGPLFIATMELWIASRTDRDLARQVAQFEPVVTNALLGALAQVAPAASIGKPTRDFVYLAMDAIRGILVADFVDQDPDRLDRRWRRAKRNLLDTAASIQIKLGTA